MSKQLLISDANIIIDIIAGELVEAMFALDYEFGVPDILFAAELEQQHAEIQQQGLRLMEMPPAVINMAATLLAENTRLKVSIFDCMALSLAQQQGSTLLTGDAKLRQLATAESVTVRGALWLVGQMFEAGHITADEAEQAYNKMLADGSRLPQDEIQKQLRQFRKTDV